MQTRCFLPDYILVGRVMVGSLSVGVTHSYNGQSLERMGLAREGW